MRKKKTLTFKKCDCVIDIQFMHQQRSMINEQHELNFVKYSITLKNNSKKNSFRQILNKINQIKKSKKKRKKSRIFKEFQ